ncbi:unnamed protein product [Blumeria hordei]|uniref:Uncharacterized protein n=2 Tax=Blumeria hordei TaxID=2867405 RepID=A0A383UP10_BLUHO|nr:hypothetical protein BGHDH14_bghG004621000001001 [Blumeria hordei DH14]SZF01536.1 unnamed protein product [Blumeria hordei]
MGVSQDSSRPIMASIPPSRSNSTRSSTFSAKSSVHSSIYSSSTQDEFSEIEAVMAKLGNKQLATQRFVPSEEKLEYLSKLALGAKLQRALRWRMIGQDAEMRVRVRSQPVQSEKLDKLSLM